MDDETVFPGFNLSFKGYSQLPNEWLDEIMQIDNVAEMKVVLYIYRHTWGFQEKKNSPDEPAKHDEIKAITTDEFMHGRKKADGTRMDRGTGLSNRSVIDGLRNAVKHGYILETVNDKDKGRVVKSYALNILKSNKNSCEESSQDPVKNPHRRVRTSHSNCENSSQRTEKNTRAANQLNERKKESAPSNVTEKNETSDSPEDFHSSIHSSTPSRKPRKMGLIQAPVRDVIRSIGDSQPEKDHFERVHNLWLECEIEEIKTFRDRIYAAKLQATGKDMEYFYRCLERQVGREP